MYKVMISYNIQPGREQEAQEFLASKMAPGLGRLGFRFSEVWLTLWGKSPQILGGGMVKDMEEAKRIFLSTPWVEMRKQMEQFTLEFQVKVVRARPGEMVE